MGSRLRSNDNTDRGKWNAANFLSGKWGLEHLAPCQTGVEIGDNGDDRSRMRSENFDWFRELGADSGKTPNSLLKSSKIFATSRRREARSSKLRLAAANLQTILFGILRFAQNDKHMGLLRYARNDDRTSWDCFVLRQAQGERDVLMGFGPIVARSDVHNQRHAKIHDLLHFFFYKFSKRLCSVFRRFEE